MLPSSLRLATIGFDAVLAEIIDAVARTDHFEWVASYDDQGRLGHRPPVGSANGQDWEALLTSGVADIVAVGQQPDTPAAMARRAEQLKRLAQGGVPLIVVHPPCDMLLAYELEMNRVDHPGPVFPYCPLADHPLVRAVCDKLQGGAPTVWGELEEIVWERFIPRDQRRQADVLSYAAQDAVVIRRMLGEISSVSATGITTESPSWGRLGIHFVGRSDRLARWSIGPERDVAGSHLTLVGSQQTCTLKFAASPQIDVELSGPLDGLDSSSSPWRPADDFLCRIVAAWPSGETWQGMTWDEVCRSLEVTDAVERSVRRRRTIELYHEQVTEQETFKSMMAAGGCGMLLWVFLWLMIAGFVEGLQLPLREMAIWRLWPVLLFAPLLVFLALQLLQLVFPAKRD